MAAQPTMPVQSLESLSKQMLSQDHGLAPSPVGTTLVHRLNAVARSTSAKRREVLSNSGNNGRVPRCEGTPVDDEQTMLLVVEINMLPWCRDNDHQHLHLHLHGVFECWDDLCVFVTYHLQNRMFSFLEATCCHHGSDVPSEMLPGCDDHPRRELPPFVNWAWLDPHNFTPDDQQVNPCKAQGSNWMIFNVWISKYLKYHKCVYTYRTFDIVVDMQ